MQRMKTAPRGKGSGVEIAWEHMVNPPWFTDGQQPRRCTISGYPVNRVEVWSENSLVPYGPRVTENSVRVQVQYATVCGERGHSGILEVAIERRQ